MGERGARSLILTSKRGVQTPLQQALVMELLEMDVDVRIRFACMN